MVKVSELFKDFMCYLGPGVKLCLYRKIEPGTAFNCSIPPAIWHIAPAAVVAQPGK